MVCAPITRTIRGIRSEVLLDAGCGLGDECVVSCDNLVTVGKVRLDEAPVGRLTLPQRAQLDRALRYALDIVL